MKQQTAVGFLENQYNSNGKLTPVDFYQAKQIEKNQIIINYNQGCIDTLKDEMKRGEQYYNETFNKDE
jgi:hypothetical protein